MITVGRRWQDLVRDFRWTIPEEFNFGALVDAWATDRSRVALYWEDEAGGAERHTFWDVKQASNRVMNALAGLGIGRGDPVIQARRGGPDVDAAIAEAVNTLNPRLVGAGFLRELRFGLPGGLVARYARSRWRLLPVLLARRKRID